MTSETSKRSATLSKNCSRSVRRKSALLIQELDNQSGFFHDKLDELRENLKRDTKHERDMHQLHDCLLWKIYEQERQIHRLMDELLDSDIPQSSLYRQRLASARTGKYPA
jgi:hypothetical protein